MPTCLRGVKGARTAVGAELDILSPIHAAVIPFPLQLPPLNIYGEVELGTQPKRPYISPSVLGGGAGRAARALRRRWCSSQLVHRILGGPQAASLACLPAPGFAVYSEKAFKSRVRMELCIVMATRTACRLALVRWVMGDWVACPHPFFQVVWGVWYVVLQRDEQGPVWFLSL